MKKMRLIILLLAGISIFIGGVFLPENQEFLRYLLMGAGAFCVLLFYFITLKMVIKTREFSSSFRILWMIVVICVPLVGNVLYLFYSEFINRRQNPVQTW